MSIHPGTGLFDLIMLDCAQLCLGAASHSNRPKASAVPYLAAFSLSNSIDGRTARFVTGNLASPPFTLKWNTIDYEWSSDVPSAGVEGYTQFAANRLRDESQSAAE
jgi:hypothetical protein